MLLGPFQKEWVLGDTHCVGNLIKCILLRRKYVACCIMLAELLPCSPTRISFNSCSKECFSFAISC